MPTLQELENAFLAADAQGNIEDAQVFATEIKRLRAEPQQPISPLGMGMARQKAELEAEASDPSMMGSFARNARENIGGGAGALALGAAGAKGGAALGAPFGPIGVGVGAVGGGLVGGITGAFIGDEAQEIVDPMTKERELQIARDMQVNPISSYLGSSAPYFAGMKPNIRGISTAFTKPTPLMGAIERNAINSARVELGVNTAIGAALPIGTALANDQPINPLEVGGNTVLGALLSAPNRFGRALGMKPTMTMEEARALQAEQNPPQNTTPPATTIPQQGPLTPSTPAAPLVATGATRLAGDMAANLGIDPLSLTPSGRRATVTPNDVRAAAANLPATTFDSGGTIDITPVRKPDPTISDLLDTNIEWEGQTGKLVDDEGRPALLREDGSLVELPFNYATERSLADLGVQPTYDRQQDRITATRFFGESENESLQLVFGVIDNNTDDLLDIAELGVSLKKQKGKKSIPVHDTEEFAPQLRSITDEQILVAEDQIKQAIAIAENNPNLSDETRTAVINKLSGDLENISAITAARDTGKYKQLPIPTRSPQIPSQRATLASAAAADNAAAARRILNEPIPQGPAAPEATPFTPKASDAAQPLTRNLGLEETSIAPVALENGDSTLPPAPRQLSPSTRAKKLGAEIGDLGRQILSQRQKISDLKKQGSAKQTITKAEKQLASLRDLQEQKKQERAGVNSEIPAAYKRLSTAATRIVSSVNDNIKNFPGLSSLDSSKIKMPPPQLALILGKKRKKIPLSAKENNFLAENNKGGEYDGYIKISDIDSMPGTPEGREAAKAVLRSIYAKSDDYTASGPDAVTDKDADTLWSELRSELSDIAQGKNRSYEDEYESYIAKQEDEYLEKEGITLEQPVNERKAPASRMDVKNQDSRELFADDGGFALASQETQDGAKITAERTAKEEADLANEQAQSKLFEEDDFSEEELDRMFGKKKSPKEDTYDSSDDPFSKTDAPAREADVVGVEKAADDFFGGKRPENVKVVNEPNANWEARVKGDTIELNAAKVGPEGVRSALHEEVGHAAFRNEKDRAAFQKLYDALDEPTRTKINETVDKLYSDASPSLKAEEKLVKALRAILDRTPEGRTFWQKLLQIARRTYKALTGQTATDPEMIAASLLRRGMNAVKKESAGENRYSQKGDATPEAVKKLRETFTPKNEVEQKAFDRATANKFNPRSGELAVAALRLRVGDITAETYRTAVETIDPWRAKGGESIPLKEKILKYIGPAKAGKVNAEIEYGQNYEVRIDIPTYNASVAKGDPVYAITVHLPVADGASRVGEPVSYRGAVKLADPKMIVRSISGKGQSIDIASGDGKFPLATVKGEVMSLDSLPSNLGDDSVWVEAGYNPVRSSGFVDVRSGKYVLSGSEAIMVGSRVFVKNAVFGERPTGIVGGDGATNIRYSKTDGAPPVESYRKALDAAKQEVADRADYRAQAKLVIAEINKLPKAEQKPAKIRMYAELDEARIIGKGKDRQFKVEMPKVAQEIIASGKTPTEADILKLLTNKFPEQKGYLEKNFDRLVSDMMFAEEQAMAGENGDWTGYSKALTEHFAEISEGVKTGSTLRHIQRGLSLFRNTYFNGIGGKMQALAEGKFTGKESAASSEFAKKINGVRTSQDGVNFEGVDGLSEVDVKRMNNERIKFDTDLEAYFKEKGMSEESRAAWLERVSDHVVNPARDAELAKDPKLKEAVDYFVKRRRERLAYLREAGVDVGDAGERSLSRSLNTEKVLSNPKEFLEKAKRAYMRKWAREISNLRNEEAIKAAEGKDTTSIKEKIRDLEKMDAQEAAEKYLYAITSEDNGISSDGNDITAASGAGQPAFLKKREFGPEADELLGKFYHRNIAAMDTAETLASVRAATKARVLAADGDPVGGWKKFRADLEAEGNQDMIPIWAQLVKDYLNLNGSNNETSRKLVGHLHTYTQLAYLSHATVASLGEPSLIGARTGRITDTGRAYTQIAKGIVRALRKAGPDEIRILNRELGIVADSFDGMMSGHAIGDSFGGRGKGGGLVTNFHRLTGLTGWTNLTFDAATKIAKSFISSQVKLAKAGGSMSTLAKRELNELGMSMKDIDVMDAFVAKLDKSIDQNSMILGNEPGADLYRKAIAMFHKTGAALNPTRGTRAQKANNPVAGMFYQLQSFLYDFHQKFTIRQARRLKDAYRGTVEIDGATEKLSARERSQVAIDAAKAVAAIYGLQYGIQILRENLFVDPERNKRDKKKTQGEINMARALGAASRTGLLGPYDTLFNIISGARYQREPATVVLGPAVGGMSELFQSVVNLYGDRNSGNTNTTERKLVRTAYNTAVTPALNAVFAGMPAGPISAALVQAFRHPLTREGAVSAAAGPIQSQKKGPMKSTTYY